MRKVRLNRTINHYVVVALVASPETKVERLANTVIFDKNFVVTATDGGVSVTNKIRKPLCHKTPPCEYHAGYPHDMKVYQEQRNVSNLRIDSKLPIRKTLKLPFLRYFATLGGI